MSSGAPGGSVGKKRSSSAANGAAGGLGGSADIWLHQVRGVLCKDTLCDGMLWGGVNVEAM